VTITTPQRDIEEALRIAGESRALANELFVQFLDELPVQMKRIHQLADQGQLIELREILHQLKGGAAVCALKGFIDALDALHAQVKAGERDRILELLSALDERAERLPDERP
jgi:HPt (histidine-containing phosphotransfer) domain-containing protein